MSNWVCVECGVPDHVDRVPGDGPYCPTCGVELSPADEMGVLKQA